MRRDRFIQIMRFTHCADNSKMNPYDKIYKVRLFMDKLKLKFLEHFVPKKNLNYNETMVKYYERHSCCLQLFVHKRQTNQIWIKNVVFECT